jgi:hypothetical protein
MAEAGIVNEDGSVAGGAAVDQTWATGFDEETRGWLGGMGVDKLPPDQALAKVIPMYRGAEKKLGVPADRLLALPKDENDADGFRAAMLKLGLPETPDGYGLKAPDGDPGVFLKEATGWMHELGIPKRQAHGLAEKWGGYVQAQQAAREAQLNAQAEKDIEGLKTELGDQYDAGVELARRVRRAAGLSDQEAQQIEDTIGVGRTMKMFAELGRSMGEHRFKGGDGGGTTFGMSPEGARARIVELTKDQGFQSKLFANDLAAKEEWTRLHKTAYPEQ